MKIAFASPGTPKSGILAVTVAADRALGALGRDLDQKTGGLLTRAMEQGRFKGKAEEVLSLVAPTGLDVARLLLVGIGAADGFDANGANNAGAAAYAAVQNSGETDLAVALDAHDGIAGDAGELAAEAAFGAMLRSYRFDKYRTTLTDDKKPSVNKVTIQTDAAKAQWLTVTELAPDNATAWYNLGFYYLTIQPADMAAAKAAWQRVIDIDPESEMARTASMHLAGLEDPTAPSPTPTEGR